MQTLLNKTKYSVKVSINIKQKLISNNTVIVDGYLAIILLQLGKHIVRLILILKTF